MQLSAGEIAAVLFDWDGTFADSAKVNYWAMERALAQEGVALDWDWYMHHSGVSTREMLEMVLASKKVAQDRIADLTAFRDIVFASQQDSVLPFADAVAAAQQCRLHNVPAVIASGGSRPVIEAHLARWNAEKLFDTIVAREDVVCGKPDPAIFLLAARQLNVDPVQCLVLEDSAQGLLAAQRAGMCPIDVRRLRDT
ncbi:hypothetical protein BKG85_05005 [Mycobacteroides chelonae]|nr:hypothetical protein BKG85_05005 [Mycobacteroides chelonae]